MIRDADIREISDGKLYRSGDLVRLDTGGCAGCSDCCKDMGGKVVLDPYDVYRLHASAGYSFEGLLAGPASLSVVNELVLPVLNMDGPGGACRFLGGDGRCSVHPARPGICRLFPLGRYYQGDDFSYILQVGECTRAGAKVRIRKWLDTPELPRYEAYIRSWHALTRKARETAQQGSQELRSMICTQILKSLYQYPWDLEESFYPQYEAREMQLRRRIGIL